MVHLTDINPDNWRLGLQVAEHQRKFVASAPWLLARAYGYRSFRSKAFIIDNILFLCVNLDKRHKLMVK